MPVTASDCSVECGTIPLTKDDCLVDEADILVDEFGLTPARELTRFSGADGCTSGVQLRNPELEISIQGAPLNNSGDLTGSQPGEEFYGGTLLTIANLANYGATPFGHDPTVGCVLLTDVSFTCSKDSDAAQIQITAMHFQHAV